MVHVGLLVRSRSKKAQWPGSCQSSDCPTVPHGHLVRVFAEKSRSIEILEQEELSPRAPGWYKQGRRHCRDLLKTRTRPYYGYDLPSRLNVPATERPRR